MLPPEKTHPHTPFQFPGGRSGVRTGDITGGKAAERELIALALKAEDYILVLFYIIGDDEIGNEFKRRLLAKVDEGVRVYVLYDELGCMTFLSQEYIDDMRRRGVEMHPFYTTRGGFNKLQYNFRNHRKIVVVDGKVALTGGINVHDDSCGSSKFYGNWRDTHTIAWGPIVQNIQFVWAEDYYWATAKLPELNWQPTPAPAGRACG